MERVRKKERQTDIENVRERHICTYTDRCRDSVSAKTERQRHRHKHR